MAILAPARGPLGAPGVFVAPPTPVREITGVRRDVAAFFGVAPRGPVWLPPPTLEVDDDVATWLATEPVRRTVPVTVTSWDEYRYHFGGFEGPGRLPYTVSAFFAGGGQQAVVGRIVHDHGDELTNAAARAQGSFEGIQTNALGEVRLFARSEGRWGNGLRATTSFRTRPLRYTVASLTELEVDEREWVPSGTLLRFTLPGDIWLLGFVDDSRLRPRTGASGNDRVLTLAVPLPMAPNEVEVVTGELEVIDTDRATIHRREVIDDVGFRADHPRWMARAIIDESTLVWPDSVWAASTILVDDPALPPAILRSDLVTTVPQVDHMTGGQDRWNTIVPEDFWDLSWVPGDEVPGDGVQSLGDRRDVGLVLVPDLYEPEPLAPLDDVGDPPTFCGPEFAVEVEVEVPMLPPAPVGPGLDGLALDAKVPGDMARILFNQQQLATWADQRRDLTLLLDVPLGLGHRQVLDWQNNFDSAYLAAYHPWIDTSTPDDRRDRLIRVNPSAWAAAIIAARELARGVQVGPANEIAVGALRTDRDIVSAHHDELHRAGINVFIAERDGIRLSAARTLSRRPTLRQLNVARLMTVLRLSLERELEWAVFEPNNERLWAEVRRTIHSFLTRLFAGGAFQGATTKEAFFVRCDRSTMTQNDIDNGRLVCLVGVAPTEPIEYIIVEVALEATSSLSIEVVG